MSINRKFLNSDAAKLANTVEVTNWNDLADGDIVGIKITDKNNKKAELIPNVAVVMLGTDAPTATTNPASGTNTVFIDVTNKKWYVCTDATTDNNVWEDVCCGGSSGGTTTTGCTIEKLGTTTTIGNEVVLAPMEKDGKDLITGTDYSDGWTFKSDIGGECAMEWTGSTFKMQNWNNDPSIADENNWTIVFSFMWNGDAAEAMQGVGLGMRYADAIELGFAVDTANSKGYFVTRDNDKQDSGYFMSPNQWYTVGFVPIGGGNVHGYLFDSNGTLQATSDLTALVSAAEGSLTFKGWTGANKSDYSYGTMEGGIKDCRLYSVILPQSTIGDIASSHKI